MISIKKFLLQHAKPGNALMHVVRILVQGIGQHAVAGEPGDCERFGESIKKISAALTDDIGPEDLLVHTGSVLKGLEDHNRRAAGHYRFQTTELQNMVKMLTSTVGKISAISQDNISVLGDIGRRVAVVSELDEVRIMKARLSDCLTDIRKEAERQQTETDETIQELRRGLERVRKACPGEEGSPAKDVVTGLPLRPEAEAALVEAGRAGSGTFAAVMVLDRLQVLNARFGKEEGDAILMAFATMIRQYLNPEDRLFRWGGPTLLALLPRSGDLELVRREIGHTMENKLEHTIQTSSRSVLIPVTARWCLFPMMAASRLIVQRIDNFAASPAGRA